MPTKDRIIFYLIVTVILISGIISVFHDYQWYDTPIVRIEKAENSLSEKSGGNGAGEKYYVQTLTGTVLNGADRGKEVQLQNQYSSSGVYDDEYQAGDEVFAQIRPGNGENLTGIITGLKRDKYVAILSALFILLILIILNKKGIFPVLSLLANIGVFWYALDLYARGYNLLMLSNCLVLFFTIVSLLFIGGFSRKTYAAILATLISICITMLLFKIVMTYTDGVDYAFMEYIANPNDLPEIFMSQMLIGGLGAAMDVAISEAAAVNELVVKDSEIPLKELLKSGREVGHDVMGTMINVMLFTYISGSIPLIILKMNNDIRLHTIILWHMPMELYRFLIGSIGILLTIPVSLLVSIVLFRKWRRFA
ncbi:MAG TPA: YibE/F family protein [Anaerovoracaceae bacterium]|nr:YibE/F family protein [Anaerovoracaceae bacterium]